MFKKETQGRKLTVTISSERGQKRGTKDNLLFCCKHGTVWIFKPFKLKKKHINFSVNPKRASLHESRGLREHGDEEAVNVIWSHPSLFPWEEMRARRAWLSLAPAEPELEPTFPDFPAQYSVFQAASWALKASEFPTALPTVPLQRTVNEPMRLLAGGLLPVLSLPHLHASLWSLCGCVQRWLACPLPISCFVQSSKLEVENYSDTLYILWSDQCPSILLALTSPPPPSFSPQLV